MCNIACLVLFVTLSSFHFVLFFSIYTPFHEQTEDSGTKAWQSFANAFILLGIIAVMTVFLLLLYKYRCYKVSAALSLKKKNLPFLSN